MRGLSVQISVSQITELVSIPNRYAVAKLPRSHGNIVADA